MERVHKLEFPGKRTGDLFVSCCGYSQEEPLAGFGPAMLPHYLIHFCLSGKGIFTVNGKKHHIKAGQGFVTMPEELVFYQADSEEPWDYVWAGFNGDRAEKTVKSIGLSSQSPVFKSEYGDDILEVFKDMMEHSTFDMGDELRRNGQFCVFLSLIADNKISSASTDTDRANHYVRKAIEFIQCNYCNPIKITEVADYVSINRSYLYTLFMNTIGLSPQQFLSTFRITKATELLQYTSLPIESIAISCGYMDSLVFTKAFKQMKGMSPSAYRKDIRNGQSEKYAENMKQVETFINQIKEWEKNISSL